MLQEIINKRQNEDDMLECQFAARRYYNCAEEQCNRAFLFSLLSTLFIFTPNTSHNNVTALCLFIPIALQIISLYYYWKMSSSIFAAATLRNYFDETVLGIGITRYVDSELRRIRALIRFVVTKYTSECDVQISHTGRDNPPGVKNWYEFSHIYNDSDVVFECQKQNQWWNNKMIRYRFACYLIAIVIGIAGMFIAHHFFQIKAYIIIIRTISLVIEFFDRINQNYHYWRLSLKIDDRCDALEISKDREQIIALQKLIAERRALRVVEFNCFHKTNSNSFSEEYEYISNHTT